MFPCCTAACNPCQPAAAGRVHRVKGSAVSCRFSRLALVPPEQELIQATGALVCCHDLPAVPMLILMPAWLLGDGPALHLRVLFLSLRLCSCWQACQACSRCSAALQPAVRQGKVVSSTVAAMAEAAEDTDSVTIKASSDICSVETLCRNSVMLPLLSCCSNLLHVMSVGRACSWLRARFRAKSKQIHSSLTKLQRDIRTLGSLWPCDRNVANPHGFCHCWHQGKWRSWACAHCPPRWQWWVLSLDSDLSH